MGICDEHVSISKFFDLRQKHTFSSEATYENDFPNCSDLHKTIPFNPNQKFNHSIVFSLCIQKQERFIRWCRTFSNSMLANEFVFMQKQEAARNADIT